ncbi:MAPEG family protein [Novosphingobium sp. Leaf2]|uniref:MAPEG family protein n=1 Tax=Novosphingobium sp. Leaf2 TaxID=1735670 RepID=UPI00070065BC|nr:MAPEG family protein [Novosphingobium sp. Leaf2]KQM13082.1 GST-like protein [Novosphingobium sp. Leaf2]
MILQTTLSLAAAAAVLNFWLGLRIAKVRMSEKILHGDGENAVLLRRMRAQANYVENTPFILILIAVIEMSGKGGQWLAIAGAIYLLARIAHAFGMDLEKPSALRAGGFIVTVLALLGLSGVAVLIALGRL